MAALAAQLHLALVDDHLAQERARVADRLAVALPDPRRGDGDLEQVAEGVASAGAAEPERSRERHEQRGLQLAVAGEPGARVMRGWGRCRAHVLLLRSGDVYGGCRHGGPARVAIGDRLPRRSPARFGGRATPYGLGGAAWPGTAGAPGAERGKPRPASSPTSRSGTPAEPRAMGGRALCDLARSARAMPPRRSRQPPCRSPAWRSPTPSRVPAAPLATWGPGRSTCRPVSASNGLRRTPTAKLLQSWHRTVWHAGVCACRTSRPNRRLHSYCLPKGDAIRGSPAAMSGRSWPRRRR